MKKRSKKVKKYLASHRHISIPSNEKQNTKRILESVADKKIGEEVKKATEKFIKSLQGKDFKPLFS